MKPSRRRPFEGIRGLLAGEGAARILGQRAHAYVEENLTLDVMVARFMRVVEEVSAGRTSM